MRTISVRQWMLVGLLIFVLVAAIFYHVADLVGQRSAVPSPAEAQRRAVALDAAQRDLTAGVGSWNDPQWQRSTATALQQLGVGAVIRSSSGQELFRAGPYLNPGGPSRELAVVQDGQTAGTIALYQPRPPGFLALIGAIAALASAFLFVRFQMGRYVVRPLEAMERAARRIAGGDLEFDLPPSRVTEVAQVGAAFRAMGDGLRDSLRRQAELEEQRRFFIGAVAHDLRTPLFALRGYLIGLEQGLADSPEKTAAYLAICREKADQLDRLVSDLFAYAKTEYLGQSIHRRPVDLAELLGHAVAGMRPAAEARGIAIDLDAGDGCCAEGDRDLLARAAGNLLDNALRHTPAGGRVEVSCGRDGDRISFSVADTGPGIAEQDLLHLLEPMYRGDAARNSKTGGAGLGLAIAARALQAHGGGLTAANRPGGGAIFTGWLPCARLRRVPAAERQAS
jgi:signal transduction histidine kinase